MPTKTFKLNREDEKVSYKKIATISILTILMITTIPLALADSNNGKGHSYGNGAMGIVGLQVAEPVPPPVQGIEVNGHKYNFQEVKVHYQEAKHEFQQQRQEMHQLSEDLESCDEIDAEIEVEEELESNETEADCEELKDEAKEAVSNQLDATGNFLLKALEKVYAKIETSNNFDSEVKEELLSKIQTNIDSLKAELDELESNEEIDNTYLTELINGMKQSWLDLKPEMSLSVALLSNSKINDVIEKLETSSGMVNERINQLESNGYNVTELRSMEEEFNNYIDSAEANRILAEELLLQFPEESTTGEIVSQAQEYNHESKGEINFATSKLRDLFFMVRMSEMEILVN